MLDLGPTSQQARKRLDGVAHRTPVLTSRQFDEAAGATVFFKAENLQRGGAFKFRGAYNKIKAETERGTVAAVVAFSSGNHAQAVALVSRLLGIRATIVMPTDAPAGEDRRHARLRRRGRPLRPRRPQSRDDVAEELCRERGAVLVPPFDDELIMAGQATGAVELFEDVPGLDAVVVPVLGRRPSRRLGDGGASSSGRRSSIYGAEPETAVGHASSRSRPAAGSKSPRTRRSPTGCA